MSITWEIPLENDSYGLSWDYLQKFKDRKIQNRKDWRCPDLKFHCYEKDALILINIWKRESYRLTLQVEQELLLVSCSCGSRELHLCKHAFAALSSMVIDHGFQYFQKFKPNGPFPLAFRYPQYFDKKESSKGINVTPRPELKAVFGINSKADPLELPEIMKLPVEQDSVATFDEVIAYLVLMPYDKKIFPAVLPCVGLLSKDRNAVKSWIHYLHNLEDNYDHLVNSDRKKLNSHCNTLWSIATKEYRLAPSWMVKTDNTMAIKKAFNQWQQLWPLLIKQRFIYSCLFYGVKEAEWKPRKKNAVKVRLSEREILLKFILKEEESFYEFSMEVWREDKLLDDLEYVTPFVVQYKKVLYRVSEVRDALLINWFLGTGGWITVFKEHYDQFVEEVLVPLKDKYPIEIIPAKKKRKVKKPS